MRHVLTDLSPSNREQHCIHIQQHWSSECTMHTRLSSDVWLDVVLRRRTVQTFRQPWHRANAAYLSRFPFVFINRELCLRRTSTMRRRRAAFCERDAHSTQTQHPVAEKIIFRYRGLLNWAQPVWARYSYGKMKDLNVNFLTYYTAWFNTVTYVASGMNGRMVL